MSTDAKTATTITLTAAELKALQDNAANVTDGFKALGQALSALSQLIAKIPDPEHPLCPPLAADPAATRTPLSAPPALVAEAAKSPLRQAIDIITNAIRSGTMTLKQAGTELAKLGLKLQIISPLHPANSDQDLAAAVNGYWNTLANDNGVDENGDPNIKPEEIKAEGDFLKEMRSRPDRRLLLILRNELDQVLTTIYAPLFAPMVGLHCLGLASTLEYQVTAGAHSKQGYGSLLFAIYQQHLQEIAKSLSMNLFGIVIEGVDTAKAYWQAVGGKLVHRPDGEQVGYGMGRLGHDPDTGVSRDGLCDENLFVVGPQSLTVEEYIALIRAFFQESYMPWRSNFNNPAAYNAALADQIVVMANQLENQFSNTNHNDQMILQ